MQFFISIFKGLLLIVVSILLLGCGSGGSSSSSQNEARNFTAVISDSPGHLVVGHDYQLDVALKSVQDKGVSVTDSKIHQVTLVDESSCSTRLMITPQTQQVMVDATPAAFNIEVAQDDVCMAHTLGVVVDHDNVVDSITIKTSRGINFSKLGSAVINANAAKDVEGALIDINQTTQLPEVLINSYGNPNGRIDWYALNLGHTNWQSFMSLPESEQAGTPDDFDAAVSDSEGNRYFAISDFRMDDGHASILQYTVNGNIKVIEDTQQLTSSGVITLKTNPDKDQIYAAFSNAQPYDGKVYVYVYNSKTGSSDLITTPFKAGNGSKIGLAIDSDNNIYIAYGYSDGVQVEKYTINTKTWQSLTDSPILSTEDINDIHLSYDKHEGLYLAIGVWSESSGNYAAFYHYTGSAFNQISTLNLSTFYGYNSGNNDDDSIRFKVIKGVLYFAYIAPQSEFSQENSVYFDCYDLVAHIWDDYSDELATLLTHSVSYFDMQVDDLANIYFVSQNIVNEKSHGDVIVVKGENSV
ncbi:hypothetical protein [Cysteiniphilum sp. QT6929]|uniref:hypothetical protein n=1 Tax=Cysteiniphilum sp. QT6929 TaxID=2975055 RepID=UPI0024B39771|nr:hypothetical protein [Cysteiniphilum sp. QT6929]WHN65089.1 SMP-30/gluconolactonase/LRE family protein [Cysteiniphilum sp. QT6929]